jgi:hypothetical protein
VVQLLSSLFSSVEMISTLHSNIHCKCHVSNIPISEATGWEEKQKSLSVMRPIDIFVVKNMEMYKICASAIFYI